VPAQCHWRLDHARALGQLGRLGSSSTQCHWRLDVSARALGQLRLHHRPYQSLQSMTVGGCPCWVHPACAFRVCHWGTRGVQFVDILRRHICVRLEAQKH